MGRAGGAGKPGESGRSSRSGRLTHVPIAVAQRFGAAAVRLKPRATLSHIDRRGRIKMVDVGNKPATAREAVARGSIAMSREARRLVRSGAVNKGDPRQA